MSPVNLVEGHLFPEPDDVRWEPVLCNLWDVYQIETPEVRIEVCGSRSGATHDVRVDGVNFGSGEVAKAYFEAVHAVMATRHKTADDTIRAAKLAKVDAFMAASKVEEPDRKHCGCSEEWVGCAAWVRETDMCGCLCHAASRHEETIVGVPVPPPIEEG